MCEREDVEKNLGIVEQGKTVVEVYCKRNKSLQFSICSLIQLAK